MDVWKALTLTLSRGEREQEIGSAPLSLRATVYTQVTGDVPKRALPPLTPPCKGGGSKFPPLQDAAGEFNNWQYRQFWESFEAPQPPILGEYELKVPQS